MLGYHAAMDGIAWAVSAMSAAQTRLDVAAANLANYNIRYVEPSDIEFVEQELGTGVVITPLPPKSAEDDHPSIE